MPFLKYRIDIINISIRYSKYVVGIFITKNLKYRIDITKVSIRYYQSIVSISLEYLSQIK
jgi:hypothetical protein